MVGGEFLQICSSRTKGIAGDTGMMGLWKPWVSTKNCSLQWLGLRWEEGTFKQAPTWLRVKQKRSQWMTGNIVRVIYLSPNLVWPPDFPRKIVSRDRWLTQRNGGQSRNTDRFFKKDLSWVPSRSCSLRRMDAYWEEARICKQAATAWRWDWREPNGGQEQLRESSNWAPAWSTGVSR